MSTYLYESVIVLARSVSSASIFEEGTPCDCDALDLSEYDSVGVPRAGAGVRKANAVWRAWLSWRATGADEADWTSSPHCNGPGNGLKMVNI